MLRSPLWIRVARAALPPALVLALAAAGPAASPGKRDAKPPADGPELRLTAAPRHAFRPLTLTLTGHLAGVESNDEEFCHAGVEWESRTPTGLTVVSKEDPTCLHPPEQVDVQMTFTKIVTLDRPGVYVYRLILHRRDGDKVMSNTQEIRVLDNN